MTYQMLIENLVPLPQYNTYEGYLEGVVAQQRLVCHVLIYQAEDWHTLIPGSIVPVDIWLERSGIVEIVPPALPSALVQQQQYQYEVIGTVQMITGEMVMLDTVLPLRIDLDVSPFLASSIPALQIGDHIRVIGTLKADLYIDES